MAEEKPKKQVKKADETAVEETPVIEEAAVVEETTPDAPTVEAEAAAEQPAPEETPEPEAPVAEETPVAEEPAAAPEAEAPVEDPAAEPEPAAEPAEEEAAPESEAEAPTEVPAEPAAPVKPAKSQKHLPRSRRRQRPSVVREKPAQRKPIVRLEKPVKEIGRHQERRGIVVSDAMDKTVVVKVEVIRIHPRYKKVIRRSRKFHAHDEGNQAKVGDVVRIVETRPLSKTKNWRLVEVVEVAK